MSKNIIYKTPDDGSYFFGFHDISPWNKRNDHIILHKLNKEINSLPSMNDKVDLVSINLSNNKIKKLMKQNPGIINKDQGLCGIHIWRII